MRVKLYLFSFVAMAILCTGNANAQSLRPESIQFKAISRVDYHFTKNGSRRFTMIGLDHLGYKVWITGSLSEGIAEHCTSLAAETMQDRLITQEISGRERTRSYRIYVSNQSTGFPVYRDARIDRCFSSLGAVPTPVGVGGS